MHAGFILNSTRGYSCFINGQAQVKLPGSKDDLPVEECFSFKEISPNIQNMVVAFFIVV